MPFFSRKITQNGRCYSKQCLFYTHHAKCPQSTSPMPNSFSWNLDNMELCECVFCRLHQNWICSWISRRVTHVGDDISLSVIICVFHCPLSFVCCTIVPRNQKHNMSERGNWLAQIFRERKVIKIIINTEQNRSKHFYIC